MDSAVTSDVAAVRAAAQAYCHAVYKAQPEVFETLCHEAFHMVSAGGPEAQVWAKSAYLARVTARDPAQGEPVYDIISIEADGDMARVKLRVGLTGIFYEDYLGFIRTAGDWKLINKLFRTYHGPATAG